MIRAGRLGPPAPGAADPTERPPVRRFAPALAVAAIAATVLAGCSTAVNETRDNAGCGPFRSGATSDAVTATGAGGAQPKVRFPTPLKSAGSQVSVLRSGEGAKIADGQVARIAVTLASGTDGSVLQRVGYDDSTVLLRSAGANNSLDRSLLCRSAGDRYALTTSVKAAFGATAASQLGVAPSATLVLVVDVAKTFLGKANGTNRLQDASLPQVVTAVDGRPGLVVSDQAPPRSRRTWIVKEGGGADLGKGTQAVVKFTAFTWGSTATVANDDSWANGLAAVYRAGDSGSKAPFARALPGVPIGSQLMYVVPSKGGQATVYVVDVLGRL